MISIEQKKLYIETALEQFSIDKNFQDCVSYIISAVDEIYNDKLKDIKLRKEFYSKYMNDPISLRNTHANLLNEYISRCGCSSSLISFGTKTYSSWLFEKCFGDITKDFKDILKEYK